MSNTLETGATVGRYRITGFLGAGAMGEVYLAEDPHIERPLAIKTVRLSGRDAEVEDRKKRLLREARAAGRMLHPNIVTLFDAGEAEGLLYLAFEYVEGKDLAGRLETGPPLQLAEILRWGRQTAEALAYAHEHGIVHRDVKPSNILIDTSGRVKVTDFGIAKMAGQSTELTIAGSVMGSPQYLSPEQIRGEELDGRSDLFSLGVVLYELLSGKRPFDGETLTTLVYKILHQEPPPVSALRAVPERLEALLVRMLAKDREERIASAALVASELAAIERELPDETLSALVTPGGVSVRPGPRSTAPLTQPAALAPASAAPTVRTPATAPVPAGPSAPAAGLPPLPPAGPPAPVAIPPLAIAPSRRVPVALVLAVVGALALVAVLLAWRFLTRDDKPFVPQVGIPATAIEASATPAGSNAATPPAAASSGAANGADGAPPLGSQPGSAPVPGSPSQQLVYPQPPGSPIDGRMVRRPIEVRPATPESVPGERAGLQPVPAVPAPIVMQPSAPAPAPVEEPEDRAERSGQSEPGGDRTSTRLNLAFRISPPDAFVLVDRTVVGKASEFSGLRGSRVFEVDPGEHTVKLRKAGMEDLIFEIDAQGTGTSTLTGRLKSLAARGTAAADLERYQVQDGLSLRIEPAGARVTVDGTPARLVPGAFGRRFNLELGPGTHRVSIAAPGYRQHDFIVEVNPYAEDDRKRVDVLLEREGG